MLQKKITVSQRMWQNNVTFSEMLPTKKIYIQDIFHIDRILQAVFA
jgi:hypothetical protein